MLFAVRFTDHPDRLEVRRALLQQHIDWIAAHPDVLGAGSIRTDDSAPPSGAIWIVRADSKEAVERLYGSDPFWTGGLRQSVEILHWSPAFPDRPFSL